LITVLSRIINISFPFWYNVFRIPLTSVKAPNCGRKEKYWYGPCWFCLSIHKSVRS